jgi:hypothetical protein
MSRSDSVCKLRWLAFSLLTMIVTLSPSGATDRMPEIRTSDVELFYRIYDAAHGSPSAAVLQREYLDAASDGVRQFIPDRIVSAESLAEQTAKRRSVYEKARHCAATLPAVRQRVSAALDRLADLLPAPHLPPVTILIGGASSGGTTGEAGVLIGLETVCSADWMQADLADRLVYLIAHEYTHVQQPAARWTEDPMDGKHSVLQVSLIEGTADFVAELIAGSASNGHLQAWTKGREMEIAHDFLRDASSNAIRKWVYTGAGTPDKPGDLGYWVGYRIAKCYYTYATDKPAAVRELIELKDPETILARSSWPNGKPGAPCFP